MKSRPAGEKKTHEAIRTEMTDDGDNGGVTHRVSDELTQRLSPPTLKLILHDLLTVAIH